MPAHVQISFREGHTFGLKTDRRVQRTLHATQRYKRRGHQQRAEHNLNTQKEIAKREATKSDRAGCAALHNLRGISRPHLPNGNQTPDNSTSDRQEQSHKINPSIRADCYMDRKFREWLPARQSIEQSSGKNSSQHATKN